VASGVGEFTSVRVAPFRTIIGRKSFFDKWLGMVHRCNILSGVGEVAPSENDGIVTVNGFDLRIGIRGKGLAQRRTWQSRLGSESAAGRRCHLKDGQHGRGDS
jgi:hypothetical protein